jgi:hypothetical protein
VFVEQVKAFVGEKINFKPKIGPSSSGDLFGLMMPLTPLLLS